jgi:hypothetical protein
MLDRPIVQHTNKINTLQCQTRARHQFEQQRLFGALSNQGVVLSLLRACRDDPHETEAKEQERLAVVA